MCSHWQDGESDLPLDITTATPGINLSVCQTSRRGALRLAAGGSLFGLIAAGLGGKLALAEEASPGPDVSKEGLYVVIRSRTVKIDASIDELNTAIRNRLAPEIATIPGFVDYYVVQNAETRDRIAVSIFSNRAGADASTVLASEFLRVEGLADYYESLEPVVLEGVIAVAST